MWNLPSKFLHVRKKPPPPPPPLPVFVVVLLADELDSYMYQTVGHQAIELYAEAMGLPLYRHTIQGTALGTGRDYWPQEADEVEDLHQLLSKIKVGVELFVEMMTDLCHQ